MSAVEVVDLEVYFLGGPNHRTSVVISAEAGLVPEKIEVECFEPDRPAGSPEGVDELVRRVGIYEESPFGGNVYLWRGWVEDESQESK